MKIKVNVAHTHQCHQCQAKVSCWYIHRKDKTDQIGTLCDRCVNYIVRHLHEVNV